MGWADQALKSWRIVAVGLVVLVAAGTGNGAGGHPTQAASDSAYPFASSERFAPGGIATRSATIKALDERLPSSPTMPRLHQGDLTTEGLASLPTADKNPKLSSHLTRLIDADGQARVAGRRVTALSLGGVPEDLRSMIEARWLRLDDSGSVQVFIEASGDIGDAMRAVEVSEGIVERFDEGAGIVQAHVPIDRLDALSANPSVRFVRLPDYGFKQAGNVTTQGDAILKANLARASFGVDGTGVKVGVISDGVGGLGSSQASGDLGFVNTATCDIGPRDPQTNGSEGTAMLEIVHDLAPGAELWFGDFDYPIATVLDFNAAVDCLAGNTDVVVDDIGFFNVGPYDGTSFVSSNTSTELNRSTNRIRTYTTAVANQATGHYQETYSQFSGISTVHRFSATASTGDALGLGPRSFDPLYLVSGGIVYVALQWNDPFGGSANDYNLYLYRDSSSSLVASSTTPQTGNQDPTEEIAFSNSGQSGYFDIVINKASGAARTFDMFLYCLGCAGLPNGSFGQPIHNFNTPSSSVPNQSDAGGGVISAGAINASEPGNDNIASYSSRGPTNDGRTKPDITGIDGVSVTGNGGFPSTFYGTSAAAPHIGAIAALALQCNPQLKAGEPGDNPAGDRAAMRTALLNSATDLGAGGMDNTYGSGRANALGACSCVPPPAGGPLPSAPPAYYHPVTPFRILDTRTSNGGFPSKVGQGCRINVQVAGVGGVPASGVSAVVLNATVTEPTSGSYLTLYPSGASLPLASNLNFNPGQTIPNLVTVKVGASGKVNVFNQLGQTHVVLDVAGWYGDTPDNNPPFPTPTATRTPTPTPTATPSPTATATPTSTATPSPTVTTTPTDATSTPTPASSDTATPTASATATSSSTGTPTPTATTTPTPSSSGYGYYHPLPPKRILDTRDGTGASAAKIGPGGTITVDVTNTYGSGVPASGVTAVVLNTTATEPTSFSYLTVFPSGATMPLASNLNFGPGETTPNLVIVKVGGDGNVRVFNAQGSTHVIFDVTGWYGGSVPNGVLFRSLPPARVLDTRSGPQGMPAGTVDQGETITVDVTGVGGVPSTGVSAVVLNVTVTGPTIGSFLTVFPEGALPLASNLNFDPGETVPNLVIAKVGSDGNVRVYNKQGSVHVIFDVAGYFAPVP